MNFNLTDFQEGGELRRYVTHIGLLALIDDATEMTEDLNRMIGLTFTVIGF